MFQQMDSMEKTEKKEDKSLVGEGLRVAESRKCIIEVTGRKIQE